ncbi:alanine racemase [Spiroplasma chrysopicola]|uniref:Putative alanine racemase domain-containing protein n=1 Tax=Spiroplasma chrysopicola DF-1 TaxID=1276227 RepID=R4UIY4_9MOLU|nr:alanine racemase [Spiroplasma chrysopicola]AGM25271.1 putative alanine racemase domain-containing protein [Spiroplasma chrysopicola DF-1]
MYPKITWDLSKIRRNCRELLKETANRNLDLVSVVNLAAGHEEIVWALAIQGIKTIGDSRVLNLKKYQDIPIKKMLLRAPMLKELKYLVEYADCTFISDLQTMRNLNQEAIRQNKHVEIILMINEKELHTAFDSEYHFIEELTEITTFSNLILAGLGTNLSQYDEPEIVINKLNNLAHFKRILEEKMGINISLISCGGSNHISIWDSENLDRANNQIRSGAGILMGVGLNHEPIPFLEQETSWLEAQIIEVYPSTLSTKITVTGGDHQLLAGDSNPNHKQAVIALGHQDCYSNDLIATDDNIKILRQGPDYTILDVTNSEKDYQVGDVIKFNLTYLANLALMNSEYVVKEYLI